ncbi:MAG: prepilin-type N-terminal cleavage/methylation domain-containing protein [Patescibacteria group bacterium]|nr:prepilin-type N-terminal cleavage/methylation domain-containing protein [Patescibacteria group bacterium]
MKMVVNEKRGFTLMELTIYIAIIGIALFAIIGVAINLSDAFNKGSAIAEVEYSSRFFDSVMYKKIAESGGINISDSIFSTNSRLSLLPASTSSNPVIIFYDSSSKRLKITESTTQFLTPASIIVNGFTLYNNGSSSVSIMLDLSVASSNNVYSSFNKTYNYAYFVEKTP